MDLKTASIENGSSKQSNFKQAFAGGDSKVQDDFKKKILEKAQKENSNLWQHPFVDVLKHFKILPGSDWKQNKKVGDVTEYFVSLTPHSFSLGQGNWAQGHQHRGHHFGQQLRSATQPRQQHQSAGSHRKIHVL